MLIYYNRAIDKVRDRKRRAILLIVATIALLAGLLAIAPNKADAAFSGPIVISSGGTYTGQWESLDPRVPAVRVNTTQPVTIINSHVRGRGDLILGTARVNLTVKNTVGQGLHPGTSGRNPGQFVATDGSFTNLVVENNTISNSAGIWAYDYRGNRTESQTVKVLRNRAYNLDGRTSNSSGGWLTDEDDQEPTQLIQLDNVRDVPFIEIAWNVVTNEPFNSRTEDVINFYRSGGTQASPANVHHNYIQGSYPALPDSQGFSGGGIIAGDAPTTASAGRWVNITDNVVVSTTNYGISVVCGTDQKVLNNRIISSGLLPDGRRIEAQNVGLSMGHAGGWGGACTAAAYQRNIANGNVLGWQVGNGRNDSWTPNCSNCSGNTSLPGPITLAMERAEWDRWQGILAANNVVVGASDAPEVTTTTQAPVTTTTVAPTTTTTVAPTTTTTVAPTTTTTTIPDNNEDEIEEKIAEIKAAQLEANAAMDELNDLIDELLALLED